MLTILEGPELSQPDLALGQGWNNAERSATNVTARVLEKAAAEATVVAVLAETRTAHETANRLLGRIGVRTADWRAVRPRLLAAATVVPGVDREVPAVLVMLVAERPTPSTGWLFDAGLAIGALGSRAIVTQLVDGPLPPELRELGVMQLDPEQPASLRALAERVRVAGRSL